MRQENVTQGGKRDISEDELPCHSIAAIDDVSGVVSNNDLG